MDKIYIVMDYVEHDLKVLMEHMTQGFRIGELLTVQCALNTGDKSEKGWNHSKSLEQF